MDYNTARNGARQRYDMAFHMLKVSFPLLKDPKLLVGILINLAQSTEYAMDAILAYERQLRLVPPHAPTFHSKLNVFRSRSLRRNNIPSKIINTMITLQELVALQKESPVTFQRGNKYVLCKKDYRLHSITAKDLEDYLSQTKHLLSKMEETLTHFERK